MKRKISALLAVIYIITTINAVTVFSSAAGTYTKCFNMNTFTYTEEEFAALHQGSSRDVVFGSSTDFYGLSFNSLTPSGDTNTLQTTVSGIQRATGDYAVKMNKTGGNFNFRFDTPDVSSGIHAYYRDVYFEGISETEGPAKKLNLSFRNTQNGNAFDPLISFNGNGRGIYFGGNTATSSGTFKFNTWYRTAIVLDLNSGASHAVVWNDDGVAAEDDFTVSNANYTHYGFVPDGGTVSYNDNIAYDANISDKTDFKVTDSSVEENKTSGKLSAEITTNFETVPAFAVADGSSNDANYFEFVKDGSMPTGIGNCDYEILSGKKLKLTCTESFDYNTKYNLHYSFRDVYGNVISNSDTGATVISYTTSTGIEIGEITFDKSVCTKDETLTASVDCYSAVANTDELRLILCFYDSLTGRMALKAEEGVEYATGSEEREKTVSGVVPEAGCYVKAFLIDDEGKVLKTSTLGTEIASAIQTEELEFSQNKETLLVTASGKTENNGYAVIEVYGETASVQTGNEQYFNVIKADSSGYFSTYFTLNSSENIWCDAYINGVETPRAFYYISPDWVEGVMLAYNGQTLDLGTLINSYGNNVGIDTAGYNSLENKAEILTSLYSANITDIGEMIEFVNRCINLQKLLENKILWSGDSLTAIGDSFGDGIQFESVSDKTITLSKTLENNFKVGFTAVFNDFNSEYKLKIGNTQAAIVGKDGKISCSGFVKQLYLNIPYSITASVVGNRYMITVGEDYYVGDLTSGSGISIMCAASGGKASRLNLYNAYEEACLQLPTSGTSTLFNAFNAGTNGTTKLGGVVESADVKAALGVDANDTLLYITPANNHWSEGRFEVNITSDVLFETDLYMSREIPQTVSVAYRSYNGDTDKGFNEFVRFTHEGKKIGMTNGSSIVTVSENAYALEKWYKVKVYVDFEGKTYYAVVLNADGSMVCSGNGTLVSDSTKITQLAIYNGLSSSTSNVVSDAEIYTKNNTLSELGAFCLIGSEPQKSTTNADNTNVIKLIYNNDVNSGCAGDIAVKVNSATVIPDSISIDGNTVKITFAGSVFAVDMYYEVEVSGVKGCLGDVINSKINFASGSTSYKYIDFDITGNNVSAKLPVGISGGTLKAGIYKSGAFLRYAADGSSFTLNDGESFLLTYWDSDMDIIIPSTGSKLSDVAGGKSDKLIAYQGDVDSGSTTIYLRGRNDAENFGRVTAVVKDNLGNDIYAGEVSCDSDGYFEVKFKTSYTELATAKINTQSGTGAVNLNFTVLTESEISDIRSEFDTETDYCALIRKYQTVLGVDTDILSNIDNTRVNTMMLAKRPYADTADIKNKVNETFFVGLLNACSDTGQMGSIFESYNAVLTKDEVLVQKLLKDMNSTEKTELYGRIVNSAAFESTEAAIEFINNNAFLVAIKNVTLDSEIGSLLEDYATKLGVDTTNYNAITDKSAVWSALKGDYANITLFKEKFAELTPAGTGGGGGAGGSGGSGGGDTKPVVIPPNIGGADGFAESGADNGDEEGFRDIASVPWAKSAIKNLTDRGIINGKGDRRFCPEDFVTRAEFVKMIAGAFLKNYSAGNVSFEDVKASDWYCDAVAKAYNGGIINGIDEKLFGAGDNITREDMVVILYRVAAKFNVAIAPNKNISFEDANSISEYAVDAIKAFSECGLVNGKGNGRFEPKQNSTRAEAAKVIYDLLMRAGM